MDDMSRMKLFHSGAMSAQAGEEGFVTGHLWAATD